MATTSSWKNHYHAEVQNMNRRVEQYNKNAEVITRKATPEDIQEMERKKRVPYDYEWNLQQTLKMMGVKKYANS